MKLFRPWLIFALLCLLSCSAALWLRSGTDAAPFAVVGAITEKIHEWYTENEDSLLELLTLPGSDTAQTVRMKMADVAGSLPYVDALSWFDHTANDLAVCSIPSTKSRNDVDSNLIYKWVDENGQTHMSDKVPPGTIASVLDMSMTKKDFTYEVIPEEVALPLHFQGQLAAGSKRMYDTWHFFLGEENLRQSHIKVRLMGNPKHFDAYYAQGSPNGPPAAGFYRMDTNEAVVKYDVSRPGRSLATTFHEISHLITASHLGPTPAWLTEGLAEYFENLKVSDQTGAIHPNQSHITLLKSTPLPRLGDYLSIERAEWYGEHRSRNYAIAWSLMNFLMQGYPGTDALKELMRGSQTNFCKPFSAVDALHNAYPGGLPRLEADWRKWLAAGHFQIQQT